ncbi:MAG: hypothetical protein M1828_000051 [Chrysothrix sp. TS-e1954]|nr:MAG: hypothetical protein M1828_000051 [Chrysothrix sp. TS-e1954]
MSPKVSGEQEAQYIPIIDGILSTADLQQISAKKIRAGLQGALDHDISSQKVEAVNALIMTRFDKISGHVPAARPAPAAAAPSTPRQATNGVSESNGPAHASNAKKRESSAMEDTSDGNASSPRKKAKKAGKTDDAVLAARLQAEENSRGRATRGGNSSGKKSAQPKKRRKQKSAASVKGSDDSDLGSGAENGKEVKRTGAFHKPMTLSPALSHFLGGETTLSRPQTVKRIWDHVKKNDLQNPKDKRQILCDENMRAVFKQDSVHMFTMNRLLTAHLWPQDE